MATEKATTKLEEHKTTLAGGLTSCCRQPQTGRRNSARQRTKKIRLPKLRQNTAILWLKQIENIGGYFENKDVREMVRDVESFARRNPAIFIGAAFGLGFSGGEIFEKSSPKQLTKGSRTNRSARSPKSADESVVIEIGKQEELWHNSKWLKKSAV